MQTACEAGEVTGNPGKPTASASELRGRMEAADNLTNSRGNALSSLAADLRGRMEAWHSRSSEEPAHQPQIWNATSCEPEGGDFEAYNAVRAGGPFVLRAGSGSSSSLDRPDKTENPERELLSAMLHESFEQFRATLSQEQANTVALAEHWAKVAAESNRVCTQIAAKLQGSNGDFLTTSGAEALLRERLREATAGLRTEFKAMVSGVQEELEITILSQAKASAREEAAAALDKVLEVEGKTLEEWTREFELARSELSRHAGHLASLEDRLAKRAGQCEDELPQQTFFLGGARGDNLQKKASASADPDAANAFSEAAPSKEPGDGASDNLAVKVVTQESEYIEEKDGELVAIRDSTIREMVDLVNAFGDRLARVEGSLAGVLTRTARQTTQEGILRHEFDELRQRLYKLVPVEMQSALERLQQLVEGPSTALRQQLECMVHETKEVWLREMAVRQEEDMRVERVCAEKLVSLELSLVELARQFKSQAERVEAVEKAACVDNDERDGKQQAFSDTVQSTMQMLITKMDELYQGRLTIPSPPPPFPLKSGAGDHVEVVPLVAAAPVAIQPAATSVRRITSAPSLQRPMGATTVWTRTPSETRLPSPSRHGDALTSSASQPLDAEATTNNVTEGPRSPAADAALSGSVSTNTGAEAVHAVGIPEDEPVTWAPGSIYDAAPGRASRSLSPVCGVPHDVVAPSAQDDTLAHSPVLRRVVSLSPGRTSRSSVPTVLPSVMATSQPMTTSVQRQVSQPAAPVLNSRLRSASPTLRRAMPMSVTPCEPTPSYAAAAPTLETAEAPAGSRCAAPHAPQNVDAPRHEGIGPRGNTARFTAGPSTMSSAWTSDGGTQATASPKRSHYSNMTGCCALMPSVLPTNVTPTSATTWMTSLNMNEALSARQSLSPSPLRQRRTLGPAR